MPTNIDRHHVRSSPEIRIDKTFELAQTPKSIEMNHKFINNNQFWSIQSDSTRHKLKETKKKTTTILVCLSYPYENFISRLIFFAYYTCDIIWLKCVSFAYLPTCWYCCCSSCNRVRKIDAKKRKEKKIKRDRGPCVASLTRLVRFYVVLLGQLNHCITHVIVRTSSTSNIGKQT